ncbi:nitrous oxide reductase family maturation protein NosD [Flagellimonas pelagia]|uniref:Nitrous oxide reductase family maturation protein NosD n=1 Tax=Flagellimonas pelagia TaxID=2306998 RepID=A0A3A1NGN8_9FLAO|nr:nitrous oxide reductase family maturation protein NosD [Allomuricauda maritima]RIV44272.1 nitrous oxide reductase family maturation protein NosD [Allomuricauda maritima]TXJ94188.1 nitrous oxide reductase family maturation protein NosD [Allomuricauda maritima]
MKTDTRHKGYILGCILLIFAQTVLAKTWTVCNSCGHSSIKQTIQLANAHDTLLVQKGMYREFEILVDKPLYIKGIGYPIVDGEKKGEIFQIRSDGVTLDGLFIINVGVSYTKDNAAIRVIRSKDFLIQNMVLEQLFFGIYLEKSSHGKVYHNRIIGEAVDEYNSGNGIQLWYSSDIEVTKNHVQGTRDGIYLEFSDQITITGNTSMDNLRYGLHFMFSDHDVYTQNTFENNGAGVAVMFSKFITMKNNTFRKNWGTAAYGMLLKEINDAEITGNTFEENTIGINIEGSNRIDYSNNDFIGNGWAIRVIGACYTNTFKGNNFLYNSFDISYNSKLNDNVFEGNFWSSYTGYDLDRNGIGDVPYRPVKLFSYVVNRTPETIVLLRSLFMDIIDFSERVSPVFTPDNLKDDQPLMKIRS